MDTLWQELVRAVPWGAVIVLLRYLDIRAQADERKERNENAKEKSAADREHQTAVASAYANAINALAKAFGDSSTRTENAIADLKDTLVEQYRNMGITQDLLEIAKMRIQEEAKKHE